MTRFKIDIPVFYSNQAFGYAAGEMDLPAIPPAGTSFPWPDDLIKARPAYFSAHQSLISLVSQQFLDDGSFVSSIFADKISGTICTVAIDGIVCSSIDEARDCAAFLHRSLGLSFNEH
mgnify:CR=1 FL=1